MQKEDLERISWGARENEDDGGEKPDWLLDDKKNNFKRWGNIQAIRKTDHEPNEKDMERAKLFNINDRRV